VIGRSGDDSAYLEQYFQLALVKKYRDASADLLQSHALRSGVQLGRYEDDMSER